MSKQNHSDPMRPEYDFKNMPGGVTGKYYKEYRASHTVKINKEDGSTEVRHFILEDGVECSCVEHSETQHNLSRR